MKLLLSTAVFTFLAVVGSVILWNQPAKASVNPWSACVSTGPQCGTDNGTQHETLTTGFVGICPTHYHYQNNGNFNQRCHRDIQASHELPEHVAPIGTSCPEGYTKAGSGDDTACTKLVYRACHTEVVQTDGCTPAGECPTACGQEASRVPDGKGGFISCDATPACEVPPPVVNSPSQPSGDNVPNNAVAPVCPDGNTTKVVANPQVVRNGSNATIKFFITEGNSANIYYKVVGQSNWQYSVIDVQPNSDNFVSFTVHDLDPKLGYTFGIQQKTGCGGGEIASVVIVDGPATQTFSKWFIQW